MTNPTTKTLLTLSNFSISPYRHELANGHTIEIVQPMDEDDKWTIRSHDEQRYYSRYNGWTDEADAHSLDEAVELVNKLEEVIATAAPFDEAALRGLYQISSRDWRFIRQHIQHFPEIMRGLLDLPAQIEQASVLGLGWLDNRDGQEPDLLIVEIDQEHRYLASDLNGWLQDQNLYGLMFAVE